MMITRGLLAHCTCTTSSCFHWISNSMILPVIMVTSFFMTTSLVQKKTLKVAFHFDAIFLYQDAHKSGQGCRLCSLCHLGRSVLPHLNYKCIQTMRFANLIKASSLSFILRSYQLNVRPSVPFFKFSPVVDYPTT